jgi:putative ABC transport system substrate-binding protein
VLPDVLFFTERAHVADLLLQRRLPAIHPARDYATAGGLLSYGADLIDLYRRAAHQVDRILRGTRPADMPVEQPSSFDLVVNGRIMTAMGLTMPAALRPLVTEWLQ